MQSEPAPGFIKHPQYEMDVSPADKSYKLLFQGVLIARSDKVIELFEGKHAVRYYFPKSSVQMDFLKETSHSTYCPFKGTARYWTIQSESGDLENGVWAYDAPYSECDELVDHVCFYTEKQGMELREIKS